MLACLDVHYREKGATAACVLFEHWRDETPHREHVLEIEEVAPYEAGYFYKRELPCLLAVLTSLSQLPETLVIDAYVSLDDSGRPGLGAHLHAAIDSAAAVIGVAKTLFVGAPSVRVCRGNSKAPLFVSSIGLPVEQAARRIQEMAGSHRVPTLLRRADKLCRGQYTGA